MLRPIYQEKIDRQTNKKQFFIFTGPKGRGQSQAIQGIWRSTRVSQEVERKRRNLDPRDFIVVSLGNNRCAKDL